MQWRNIVRGDVAAPGSATEGHGWRQRGRKSDRAMRRGRVYRNSRRRHFSAITDRGFARACMYAGGMAHAAVMQHLVTAGGAALEAIFHVESQNRRELLHRQRKIAAHSAHISH